MSRATFRVSPDGSARGAVERLTDALDGRGVRVDDLQIEAGEQADFRAQRAEPFRSGASDNQGATLHGHGHDAVVLAERTSQEPRDRRGRRMPDQVDARSSWAHTTSLRESGRRVPHLVRGVVFDVHPSICTVPSGGCGTLGQCPTIDA